MSAQFVTRDKIFMIYHFKKIKGAREVQFSRLIDGD